MGGLKLSRDSRGGKFRELPHFPAIPAHPLGGGNWRDITGRDLKRWLLRIAGAIASLSIYF